MREVELEAIDELLLQPEEEVLLLAAPNYEARSITAILHLNERMEKFPNHLSVGLLTFQSERGRVEPLEHLKRENISVCRQILDFRKARYAVRVIRYPDGYDQRQIHNALDHFLPKAPAEVTVIFDISSMPTRVIFDMMNMLSEAASIGRVKAIYVAYSWPVAYPRPRHPTESGEPVLLQHGEGISNALHKYSRADVAVIIGGQGFQTEQFVAALPRDRTVSIYAFLNRNNVLYSLDVLRSNHALFFGESTNSHLYLSIEMGHEKLVQGASQVSMQDGCAYLAVPFGPKPLVVSCWVALRMLRQKLGNRNRAVPVPPLVDAVLLSSHHYGSPYSLGRAGMSVFSLSMSEVLDDV